MKKTPMATMKWKNTTSPVDLTGMPAMVVTAGAGTEAAAPPNMTTVIENGSVTVTGQNPETEIGIGTGTKTGREKIDTVRRSAIETETANDRGMTDTGKTTRTMTRTTTTITTMMTRNLGIAHEDINGTIIANTKMTIIPVRLSRPLAARIDPAPQTRQPPFPPLLL